jgi:hypothetical protein
MILIVLQKEDKHTGEEIRNVSMTTLRKRKQASPTSNNSDQENTPLSSKCRKMTRRQLFSSDMQTVVLEKIDEDSRHHAGAAFEERIENILVGSAAKVDAVHGEFTTVV